MQLNMQKRLAAAVMNCSEKRVVFDNTALEEIKEAITKADVRRLISKGIITIIPARGISRGRARHQRIQKIKGHQKGHGSRKGNKTARTPRKEEWVLRRRAQKKLLKALKEKQIVDRKTYRQLCLRSKGGFFRSRRHLKLYITEHNLALEGKKIL